LAVYRISAVTEAFDLFVHRRRRATAIPSTRARDRRKETKDTRRIIDSLGDARATYATEKGPPLRMRMNGRALAAFGARDESQQTRLRSHDGKLIRSESFAWNGATRNETTQQ